MIYLGLVVWGATILSSFAENDTNELQPKQLASDNPCNCYFQVRISIKIVISYSYVLVEFFSVLNFFLIIEIKV